MKARRKKILRNVHILLPVVTSLVCWPPMSFGLKGTAETLIDQRLKQDSRINTAGSKPLKQVTSKPKLAKKNTSASRTIQQVGMISPVGNVATGNGYAAFNGIGNHSYHTGIDLPGENEKTVVHAADSGTVYEVVGLAHASRCKDPNANPPCSEEEKLEKIRIWNDVNNNGEVNQGELEAPKNTDREFQDNHGYGMTIVIYHSDQRLYTQYSHLSAIKKEIWEAVINNNSSREVNKGDAIGVVGHSADKDLYKECPPFCPHLHFEVKTAHDESGQLTAKYPYWGYTPDIPENYGYQDPLKAIHPPSVANEVTPFSFRVIDNEICPDGWRWCEGIERGTRIYSGPGANYAVLGWTGKDQVLVAESKVKTIDTCKDGSKINREWYRTYLPNRPGLSPTYGWVPSHRCKKKDEKDHVTLFAPETTAQILNIKQEEYLRREAGEENCSSDVIVTKGKCVQVWDRMKDTYRTTRVWNGSRFAIKSTMQIAGQPWYEIYIPRIYFLDAFKACDIKPHPSDNQDQCVGDISTAWIPSKLINDAQKLGKANILQDIDIYQLITTHETTIGRTVYTEGYPKGNIISHLKKGDTVAVIKVFFNDSESKFTLKVMTEDGKTGYILRNDVQFNEPYGDRGTMTSIYLQTSYDV